MNNFHDPRMSSSNFDHLTTENQTKKVYTATTSDYRMLGIFSNVHQAHAVIVEHLDVMNYDVTSFDDISKQLTNKGTATIHFNVNGRHCATIKAYNLNEPVAVKDLSLVELL